MKQEKIWFLSSFVIMRSKIKNKHIADALRKNEIQLPKYVSQILNLANANAQGTRPKIVGQMTELIKEFGGNKYQDWLAWYLKNNPDAIDLATNRVYAMILNLKAAIKEIDKDMTKVWVEDLVLLKTFSGIRFQEFILDKIAKEKNLSYRMARPDEEARGIDGYIGKMPISIKPFSYKHKPMLNEGIDVKIIYYAKKKDGIVFEYEF